MDPKNVVFIDKCIDYIVKKDHLWSFFYILYTFFVMPPPFSLVSMGRLGGHIVSLLSVRMSCPFHPYVTKMVSI